MKFYTTVLFLLSAGICFSQDFEITGKIVNEEGSALESATVYAEKVADSSLISYTISDRQGSFKLEGNSDVKLELFISYTGYELYRKILEVKKEIQLDTLVLKVQDNQLDEVLVEAQRSPVTIKKDTLEFNASSFKTRPNANLEELLEVLPGVEVDREGNITVNGKPVSRVLVEGDSFFGGDHRIATKNLPKEIIDKVQVVDTKTKAEEFAGRQGDPEKKTINVTFKKDKNRGYFARATAGGGTDEHYELNGMANFFNKKIQASVISNSNNINSPGYTFAQDVLGNRVPIGGSNGITKAESAGATFLYKKDSWRKVKGDYFFGRNDTNGWTLISRENILPNSRYFTNSEEKSNRVNDSHRANASTDYIIGRNRFSISSSFNGDYDNSFRSSTEESLNKEGDLINSSESFRTSQGVSNSFSNRIGFSRRFGEKGSGSSLELSLSQSHVSGENESYFNSETVFFEGEEQESQSQDQYIDEEDIKNGYSFAISKHSKLSEKLSLAVNYEIDYSNTTSKRFVYEDGNGAGYDRFNNLLSEDFELTNTIHKPHLDIRYNKSFTWIFWGTVGLQHTRLQSEHFLQDTSLDNSYNNLFATGYLKYSLAAAKSLALHYTSGISIPSVKQMLPVVDRTNPLNIVQGNPGLKPTYSHNIQLIFTNLEFPDMNGWWGQLKLNFTENNVVPIVRVGEDLVRTTSFTNVDGGMNAYAVLGYDNSIKFKSQDFEYGASLGADYTKNVGFLNGVKFNSQGLSFSPGIHFDYSVEDIMSFIPNYKFTYNISRYDISRDINREFSNHAVGIKAISYWPTDVVFNNDINWNYYGNVSPGFDNSSLLWNMSLGYQFLDDKAILNLNIYDLLNQNIDTRRTIGDDYIQDVNSLILKRYFMLSFTYKLGKFGKGAGSNSGDAFRVIGN